MFAAMMFTVVKEVVDYFSARTIVGFQQWRSVIRYALDVVKTKSLSFPHLTPRSGKTINEQTKAGARGAKKTQG